MSDLESHWLAERLALLSQSLTKDGVVKETFSRLKTHLKAKGWSRLRGEVLFICECRKALRNLLRSSDPSRSRKELYREQVVGSDSDPLEEWLG